MKDLFIFHAILGFYTVERGNNNGFSDIKFANHRNVNCKMYFMFLYSGKKFQTRFSGSDLTLF